MLFYTILYSTILYYTTIPYYLFYHTIVYHTMLEITRIHQVLLRSFAALVALQLPTLLPASLSLPGKKRPVYRD